MTILNNGNVGIGINVPVYKLDISGDINFTGSVLSNGSIWKPIPILSDTTSSVLYVGGLHHTDTENAFIMTSLHNPNSTSCHLRLTNSSSTTTNDLSGTVLGAISSST